MAVVAAALLSVGHPSAFAQTPGAAARVVEPVALTARHTTSGWVDLTQAGRAVLSCPDAAPACRAGTDPGAPTGWVDVDSDPSTVNSSRADLLLPPGATVGWAGLYWGGDRATREEGVGPRCEAAPDGAEPAVPAPRPDDAHRVRVGVAGRAYTTVAAADFSEVVGPGGGAAFQAYADLTAQLRVLGRSGKARRVPVTVADIQVAQGPACVGGWTVTLVYAYPSGPNETYAPEYRSLAVYDGLSTLTADGGRSLRLDGFAMPFVDAPRARLTWGLLAAGQAVGPDGVSVGGVATPVRPGDTLEGPGYHLAAAAVPDRAVVPGGSATTVDLAARRSGFVGAVIGISAVLPVTVDLSVAITVNPPTVTVGGEATLTVTVRNEADIPASGVVVTAPLPGGAELTDDVDRYRPGTGEWTVGTVAARGSAQLVLRVRAVRAGTLTATAEVTASDLPDADSTAGDGGPSQDDLAAFTLVAAGPPPTSAPARAAVAQGAPLPWPDVPAGVLFGVGIFTLGFVMLSIIVIRLRLR
jgi:uncharacterized repeat protein (TIGR01451 family)